VRRFTIDSINIITLLTFISINNCLGIKGKTLFFMESNCPLRVNRGQDCRSVYFIYSKSTILSLEAKKNWPSIQGVLRLDKFICIVK